MMMTRYSPDYSIELSVLFLFLALSFFLFLLSPVVLLIVLSFFLLLGLHT